MPSSSSRSKSHKQIKTTSRDYSGFEELDLKNNTLSGEKRKFHPNGKVLDEFSTPSKRRNYGGGSDESEVVNIIDTDLKLKRSGNRADKESGINKILDGKYEIGVLRKGVENESSKPGRECNECPREDEMRNIELEKELEKRAKKREVYSHEYNKHKDTVNYKDNGGQVIKSKDVKHRGESEKDYKHRNDKKRKDCERDRNREDSNRDYKHKEERYKEDIDWDHRHKTGWTKDDSDRKKRSRDHPSELETENLKDVSRRQTNNRDRSPVYDDRVSRHKDTKERRRDNDKAEITDYRSRSIKDPHSESKRPMNDVKIDRNSERGRSSTRNDDMEITGNHSRHRSPNNKYYPSKDHLRDSNQEDRGHQNVNSSRDVTKKIPSRSLEKITQKDDNCTDDLPVNKRPRSEVRSSTISPSSKSNEHRDLSRHDVRRNLDVKELGQQNHDSPVGFGSSENDRGKINNHNWRSGDPNMGIWSTGQSNWNNFPNWPSPLPIGGYIPFHHVPPPIFNPAMQQYMPSMFGRPPMSMNYANMPYHLPAGGPPMNVNHGWEANNGVYGNWDHGSTTQLNNQIWGSSADVQPAVQKNENSAQIPTDEILSGQTSQPIENEQSQLDINTSEVKKVTESSHVSIVEMDDATLISRAYLSKIDISKDLTRPDLYEQCRNILDSDQESASDESDCKILFFEDGLEGDISNGASLFDADDSVYKKAMSLYRKHKANVNAMNQEGVANRTTSISAPDHEENRPDGDMKMAEEALEGPDLEDSKENDDLPVQKLDTDPMNEDTVNDEQLPTSEKMEMEVDHPVPNQEKESSAASVDGCKVKVKDSCNADDDTKEGDKLSSDGDASLLVSTNVLTSDLIESGSVNLSRIHHESPESTH